MSWAEDEGYDAYDVSFSNDEDGVWITKDRKEINIKDMEDKHLYFAYRKFNDDRLLREMMLRLFKERHGIK